MTIKKIDKQKCRACSLIATTGCPIMESCHTDVIRLDKSGLPNIEYVEDCDNCFLCQIDCPYNAVELTPDIPLPMLPYLYPSS